MPLLLVLLPAIPGVSGLILLLFGRRMSPRVVSTQAVLASGASFGIAAAAFFRLLGSGPAEATLGPWIVAGTFRSSLSLAFDPLAAVMALVVTGVGTVIHVYSAGYMARDRSLARYFALLNLFLFFMLLLVLASDLVLLFVGWEGVGLCSYLLIGFWYERPAAADAGRKAFLVTRIGDAAFVLGLILLVAAAGSGSLTALRSTVANGSLAPPLATAGALLLFAGAAGKSAQVPLHVWLPDAMEGPTPVSALIHAATMVTAGVYLLARLGFLIAASSASAAIAPIGAATILLGASIALVQTDIKRVLAYSTISQLGYMILGCGVGAYAAGVFHLFTHAFFKSLLFLAAGSVIHALGGEQDIRRMGGLRRDLPRTFPTFLVGAMALAGLPFLSGFFSKDAILAAAFAQGRYDLWIAGLLGAALSAFYMFRLVFLVFYGRERNELRAAAAVHESPVLMTTPLFILAGLSAVAGFIGLPAVFGERADLFGRFLAPALPSPGGAPLSGGSEAGLLVLSGALALAGVYAARAFYLHRPSLPGIVAAKLAAVYRLLSRKFYFNEAYETLIVRPAVRGGAAVYRGFDLEVIDGAVSGAAAAADDGGRLLGAAQTGLIKDYVLAFLAGAVIFVGALLL